MLMLAESKKVSLLLMLLLLHFLLLFSSLLLSAHDVHFLFSIFSRSNVGVCALLSVFLSLENCFQNGTIAQAHTHTNTHLHRQRAILNQLDCPLLLLLLPSLFSTWTFSSILHIFRSLVLAFLLFNKHASLSLSPCLVNCSFLYF